MSLGPLIVDVKGTVLTEEEQALLLEPTVGGLILFKRNIDSYAQLCDLVASIRELRSDLLICVDQEGGRVQRCKEGFTRLPPMQVFHRIAEKNEEFALQLARDTGWLLAGEILAVGIDFSLTPVLDIDENFSSVIGDRSFSPLGDRVVQLAGAFIEGAHEAGMAVTGKHFPGHGGVAADSHLERPVDGRSLEVIESDDMMPFVKLMSSLDAIMPAHILFPGVDERYTVGFSSRWLQDILRHRLAYTGVIISDDLSMEGAAKGLSYRDRVSAGLDAGCDFVLVCNNAEASVALAGDDVFRGYDKTVQGDKMRAKFDRAFDRSSERWRRTHQVLEALCSEPVGEVMEVMELV